MAVILKRKRKKPTRYPTLQASESWAMIKEQLDAEEAGNPRYYTPSYLRGIYIVEKGKDPDFDRELLDLIQEVKNRPRKKHGPQ